MACVRVAYFSISLFLQVRGTQEAEDGVEDEGALGSILQLSPLLVEGISVNTGQARTGFICRRLPMSQGLQ